MYLHNVHIGKNSVLSCTSAENLSWAPILLHELRGHAVISSSKYFCLLKPECSFLHHYMKSTLSSALGYNALKFLCIQFGQLHQIKPDVGRYSPISPHALLSIPFNIP